MNGFYGRIIEIDMNNQSFVINHIPEEILRGTLGGKGLATHLLIQHNPPQVDALSPDNNLIIATGPATDTAIWGSCRHGVFTKFPQTGYYSESYSGGTTAEYMARTAWRVMESHGEGQTLTIDKRI